MRSTERARHRAAKVIIVAGMMVGSAVGTALPASAASGAGDHAARPNGCISDPGYSYSSVHSNYGDMVPPASAPGGHTLSIQINAGTSITGTIGGSVGGDLNGFLAGAHAEVNASLAVTLTASVTYGDSWTVPSSWRIGYLHAGGERDSFSWKYGYYTGGCTWVTSRSGTADLPYHIPAFWSGTS